MTGIKGHDYTWSKSWIEFKAPNAPGVYCLRDKEGKVLIIGKGKVRERLLSHWNRENSADEAIWAHKHNQGPSRFASSHTPQGQYLRRTAMPACLPRFKIQD